MRYVILGWGGHARMVRPMVYAYAAANGDEIVSLDDDRLACCQEGDPVPTSDAFLFMGVGDPKKRRELFEENSCCGWPPLRHETAFQYGCSERATQVMAGAIVQTSLGQNILVNTGAQIDHDCKIGDHCVISPGAVLCGEVTLGEACFVGASATILQGVILDAGTFVPAGTLVVGPDDFRKPVPMVRIDGEDQATLRPLNQPASIPAARYRVYTDPQPRRAADGQGPAECARSDLS